MKKSNIIIVTAVVLLIATIPMSAYQLKKVYWKSLTGKGKYEAVTRAFKVIKADDLTGFDLKVKAGNNYSSHTYITADGNSLYFSFSGDTLMIKRLSTGSAYVMMPVVITAPTCPHLIITKGSVRVSGYSNSNAIKLDLLNVNDARLDSVHTDSLIVNQEASRLTLYTATQFNNLKIKADQGEIKLLSEKIGKVDAMLAPNVIVGGMPDLVKKFLKDSKNMKSKTAVCYSSN